MTEQKWTPGPWHYRGTLGPHSRPDLKGPYVVENKDGIQLCILNGWRDDMSLANAHLIAAAPEMAALLERWLDRSPSIEEFEANFCDTEALLARIKGDVT